MLYRNISPFCEPLKLCTGITFQLDLFLCLICIRIFCCIFVRISLLCHTNFTLCFVRTFCCLFPYEFSVYFSPLFLCSFRPYFNTDFTLYFLLFLSQIRLPRLFCFYNLTKRSSYSLLHAVPLKMNLIVFSNFLYILLGFECTTHLAMSLIVFFF